MKLKKPLPKWAVPAGIAAGGLVVLAIGWMLVVSPVKKHIAALGQQTLAIQQQTGQRIAADHPASSASSAPQIHVADIYRIAEAMPSIVDMPDILLQLDQTASAAGVTMGSISPGTPVAGATGYSTIPISLTATGNFYTVTDLLYRLQNLVSVRNGALDASGRLYSIDSVSLSPQPGNLLAANVSLETYVYGTVNAPGAPATTTTATTSTDTTSTDTTATTTTSTASSGG